MADIEPHYLPWQAGVLQAALKLRFEQRLPQAVMIDSAGETDISAFIIHLAMLLLCDQVQDLSPCGSCEACRMMQAGTYSDFSLVTLEPDEKTKKMSKNIKIDQIRNLIHEVSLTHQYDRLKIAAIYPAEAMNKASANALLKTLEEPAPRVLILLLTHNSGRIPITLRSRCQSWSINPPTSEQALAWLAEEGLSEQDSQRYLDYAMALPQRRIKHIRDGLPIHIQQGPMTAAREQLVHRGHGPDDRGGIGRQQGSRLQAINQNGQGFH